MASFRQSFQLGERAGDRGIAAYDRSKSWADRLTAREEAKDAARIAQNLELDRHVEARGDKALEREAADSKFARTQAETERHNKAMEGQYAPGSRGVGSGRGLKLSEYQREQLLARSNANYLEAIKQNNAPAVQMFGSLIEEYGGTVPEYKDNSWWWQDPTPRYEPASGAPASPRAPASAAGEKKPWQSYLKGASTQK